MAKKYRNTPNRSSFRGVISHQVCTLVRFLALLLPFVLYVTFALILYPVPNRGFIILGIIGTLLLGLGLFSFLGLERKFFSIGHLIAIGLLLFGGILVAITLFVLYCPSTYERFNEKYVTYYFLMWGFLVIPIIWYAFFRMEINTSLRNRGISKTTIKKSKSGIRNYWWYEALHKEYGMGHIYTLNKLFTILYSATIGLHLLLGWWFPSSSVITALFSVVCLDSSLMWGFSAQQWNTSNNRNHKQIRNSGESAILGIIFPIILCFSAISYVLRLWNTMN